MKNVMVRAWEIAKAAVKRFGGNVRDFFAQALAMAWAEVKAPKCAKVELAADTRKFRTWIAAITGTHPIYKLDRKFLNQDTTDEYGDKIFYLNDGAYEFNNGKRRGFFFIRKGQWVDATQAEIATTFT
ncbi:hypothetical protein J41TS12_10460 [Paenibacillus antibioticophila]|uniref:Uncharacterized protein n=1 Tax=Paenibacillus antibioticophila TaxID=1274374 RepID=A0A919XTK4_9BACL|nr:hypothetical protein [Paenibacillus antibioticophila]GIO36185.1 hypothetical protein J41TS12_10460 [Paenibacillus antibioticophila]